MKRFIPAAMQFSLLYIAMWIIIIEGYAHPR